MPRESWSIRSSIDVRASSLVALNREVVSEILDSAVPSPVNTDVSPGASFCSVRSVTVLVGLAYLLRGGQCLLGLC